MKTKIFILAAAVAAIVFGTTSCTNLIPERQYPNPGYVQTSEVLPSNNPVTAISLVSDFDTITVGTPFRVNVVATYQKGNTETVSYKTEYAVEGGISQTNLNEFLPTVPGYATVHARYEKDGATCTASVRVYVRPVDMICSLALVPDDAEMAVGQVTRLSVIATYDTGLVKDVTCNLDDSDCFVFNDVVERTNFDEFLALKPGAAKIRLTYEEYDHTETAECTVIVK